jgi:hypothetical protein
MKYQISTIVLGILLIATLTFIDRHNQPTEVLRIERTQDGSKGEFSVILKNQAHYELTQRELDSILISLATDTIK